MSEEGLKIGQNNLKELFDEFKFHLIYKNKQKKVTRPKANEWSVLLGQIKQDTLAKRSKKRQLQEAKNSKIRNSTIRPKSTLHNRIWNPQPIDNDSMSDFSKNLMVVQNEKHFLKEQISNLESSLSELKKNVNTIRKKVQQQRIKEQKYKNISCLSYSIQRNTESTKILNNRSYKKMVDYHEQTLNNLKIFKTNLRKQNQDLENKFINIGEKQNKQKKKDETILNKQYNDSSIKIDKHFISRLEELIQLLMKKEQSFQEIKAQQTTKIRLKKIRKQYLKQDRVKLHQIIDKFQDAYDVKIQSLPNLIIYIFKKLNIENDAMEHQCIKFNEVKELLLKDCKSISEKQTFLSSEQTKVFKTTFEDDCQPKRRKIFANSQILVKIMMLLHNLIGKFKYLFTMTLTLCKEKKQFHELLMQIQSIYKPNDIFNNESNSDQLKNYHQITNLQELQQIFRTDYPQNHQEENHQILELVFTDLRNSLIFKKKWLELQLCNWIQSDNIIQKTANIQNKCDQAYENLLKKYSYMLVKCIKALTMNKYEKKMAANSNTKDCLFMSVPKSIRILNLQENSFCDSTPEGITSNNLQNKYVSQESDQDTQQFQFSSDPRKIMQILSSIKNDEKKKFKPLKLNDTQVYMYDRKVVLPKYIL